MKNIKYILALLIAWSVLPSIDLIAQQSKHGYQLPTEGTVRVLIVFAELVGSCGNSPGNWTSTGGTLPPNADKYLDTSVVANPYTKLSKYYQEMSFGEHRVIGDYYGETVQVDCSTMNGGNYEGVHQVVQQLNQDWQPAANGKYYTQHGYSLDDFDEWEYTGQGDPKANDPDGYIDALVILWRNHYSPVITCGAGLGIGNTVSGAPLLNKAAKVYGAWEFCPSKLNTGYDDLFVTEYFHALFGGNNFHTGGGAAAGTFMFGGSSSFSTTAQSGSTSNVACGWDRQFMEWKGSNPYAVSALDQFGNARPSDINVTTHPNTTFFVLRDFITEGDAVRIKLPHFDWQTDGDKKNQYLWLENHQMVSEFDHSKTPFCGDWVKGMHAYIQAGKDRLSGANLYNGSAATQNALNDHLFPLPAEGRWDYYYSYGDANQTPGNCQWNNRSIPYAIQFPDGSSLANPFTGFSDLYGSIDSNQDGILGSGDGFQPSYQKWLGTPTPGSPPPPTLPTWGDAMDPFTWNGQKISIARNPSPTPIYTQREGANTPSNYDNRTIHLNNLAITIVDNNYYNAGPLQPKAFLIKIQFDDNCIDENVRWCGNIVLKNDTLDLLGRTMGIRVKPGKCIILDKGLSPTKKYSVPSGSGDFTDSTYLHLLDGTEMILENGAQLKVRNGSVFHVQSGATLILGPNAIVDIDATSVICIEDGANVIFQDPNTSRIIINGTPYAWDYNLVNTVLSAASTNYYALNNIKTSGTSPGVQLPATGNVLLEAKNTIVLSPNTYITPASNQSFLARIRSPYDCSNTENYLINSPNDLWNTSVLEENHNHDHQHGHGIAGESEEFGTEELNSDSKKVTVYPNPAIDQLNIRFEKVLYQSVEIIIYDHLGKARYSNSFATDMRTLSIPLENWSSGMYMIMIKRGEQLSTQKLIVN